MATHAPTTPKARPSRRDLLSAAGFTGLAAVAAAGFARPDTLAHAAPASAGQSAAGPDAELISLIAFFNELEHQVVRSHREDGESDEAEAFRTKLQDRQRALLRQIVTRRSTTLEGAKARARMLHLWHAELEDEGSHDGDYWDDRMVWALVRDLVGAA